MPINVVTSGVCNVVGGEDCVALVINCYMKINLFHDRQYALSDGFFQYILPTESTDDNGNLINISKY